MCNFIPPFLVDNRQTVTSTGDITRSCSSGGFTRHLLQLLLNFRHFILQHQLFRCRRTFSWERVRVLTPASLAAAHSVILSLPWPSSLAASLFTSGHGGPQFFSLLIFQLYAGNPLLPAAPYLLCRLQLVSNAVVVRVAPDT